PTSASRARPQRDLTHLPSPRPDAPVPWHSEPPFEQAHGPSRRVSELHQQPDEDNHRVHASRLARAGARYESAGGEFAFSRPQPFSSPLLQYGTWHRNVRPIERFA